MKEETVQALKRILDQAVERREIAGGSLCVEQDGREVCYVESGFADIEHRKPIRRDGIYRLYSMSKPITAAAVFALMEQGIIDLAEPVSAYIPSFRGQAVQRPEGNLEPAEREVVIKDLLDMTSGLVYPGGPGEAGRKTDEIFSDLDRRLFTEHPMDTAELAARLGQAPLAFQPGSDHLYGSSADVLGAVLEKASGMRFSQLLGHLFLEPLGMKDTGFYVPLEKRDRLVRTYEDREGELVPYLGNHLGVINRMDREPAFESGGAGLVSTTDDFMKFSRMLLQDGEYEGKRILKPATVRMLTEGSLSGSLEKSFQRQFFTLQGYSYGNLMRVRSSSAKAWYLGSVGEYGWDGWLGCYMSNDPVTKRSIVFMTQKKDAGTLPVARKLRNMIYAQ